MHQRCKHTSLARRCSGCTGSTAARAPEEMQCHSCVLVLVQSPVAPEGGLKAKPIWVCLVLAEAIKGKVQVAAVSRAGSLWHIVGYLLEGDGVVCPHHFPELV